MELFNSTLLVLSLAISGSSLLLIFIWRKKDFQITILKEQISAYNDLIENLFATSQDINTAYNEKVGKLLSEKGIDYSDDDLNLQQTLLFAEFSKKYNESFNRFQALIHLLPEDVIDTIMDYYKYMAELFRNNNDAELGVKLLTDLNQKTYEVVNAIRDHMAIDDITERTKKMLSEKQQLKFIQPQ
jgi:hypothetical protein